MDEQALLERVSQLCARQGQLIELSAEGRAVFVGETHGEVNASQTVAARYLNPETTLVFLGDYVDRGPDSRENILYSILFSWS
jgi:hypothetical protein